VNSLLPGPTATESLQGAFLQGLVDKVGSLLLPYTVTSFVRVLMCCFFLVYCIAGLFGLNDIVVFA
jgi:hypothetical protein